jgi:hypothetical protein
MAAIDPYRPSGLIGRFVDLSIQPAATAQKCAIQSESTLTMTSETWQELDKMAQGIQKLAENTGKRPIGRLYKPLYKSRQLAVFSRSFVL